MQCLAGWTNHRLLLKPAPFSLQIHTCCHCRPYMSTSIARRMYLDWEGHIETEDIAPTQSRTCKITALDNQRHNNPQLSQKWLPTDGSAGLFSCAGTSAAAANPPDCLTPPEAGRNKRCLKCVTRSGGRNWPDLFQVKRWARATGVYREQQQITWQNVPMAGKKIQAVKAAMLFRLPFKRSKLYQIFLRSTFARETPGCRHPLTPDSRWDEARFKLR